jgi:hypothetical protein
VTDAIRKRLPDGSIEVWVEAGSRIARARFAPDTSLTGAHGRLLVEVMRELVSEPSPRPFALLADAGGVVGTDADYRATTGDFFSAHRESSRIAVLNLHPIIRVVAEMFRVGMGLSLRTFSDEASAREWLRTQGIE